MFKGTIYSKTTGEIISTCRASAQADLELQCLLNDDWACYHGDEYSSLTHKIVDDTPVAKTLMPLIVNGQPYDYQVEEFHVELGMNQPLRIEGIPVGTTLRYIGNEIQIDDGFIEWVTETPGDYQFTFELTDFARARVYASAS